MRDSTRDAVLSALDDYGFEGSGSERRLDLIRLVDGHPLHDAMKPLRDSLPTTLAKSWVNRKGESKQAAINLDRWQRLAKEFAREFRQFVADAPPKKSRVTTNDRMRETTERLGYETVFDWPATKWAKELGVDPSTIIHTRAWESIMVEREVRKKSSPLDQQSGKRGVRHNGKPMN